LPKNTKSLCAVALVYKKCASSVYNQMQQSWQRCELYMSHW